MRRRDGSRPRPGATRLRRFWQLGALALAFASLYPAAALTWVYWHTAHSGLPGGRHGPRDAYRHALASGFVAFTLSPDLVAAVSALTEGNSPSGRMDRQNNAIGADLGAQAQSLTELRSRVLQAVASGQIEASDPHQMTWLPRENWSERPF